MGLLGGRGEVGEVVGGDEVVGALGGGGGEEVVGVGSSVGMCSSEKCIVRQDTGALRSGDNGQDQMKKALPCDSGLAAVPQGKQVSEIPFHGRRGERGARRPSSKDEQKCTLSTQARKGASGPSVVQAIYVRSSRSAASPTRPASRWCAQSLLPSYHPKP